MDDKRFDALARHLRALDRRRFLKGLVAATGIAIGIRTTTGQVHAARRGSPGPTFPRLPTPPPAPCVDGTAECVIPEGGTSIRICDQGVWQNYPCVNDQICISYPDANVFCEITT